jgi:hypothetical protein
MDDLTTAIRRRYYETLERIEKAAQAAGRDPRGVRLVVVSKAQPFDVVQAALAAGIRLLGENYAEEAVEKILALGLQSGVEWHMIGHVQSRKAGLVAEHFDLFHSLDSLKLAQRVNRFAAEYGRTLPVLLEFNIGGEDSKHGWSGEERDWQAALPEIEQVLSQPNLKVRGLMAMPPFPDQAEQSRPYFRQVCRLQEFLGRRFPAVAWEELSMGTSVDFEVAVQEGATLVRVGTAVLGPRRYREEAAG